MKQRERGVKADAEDLKSFGEIRVGSSPTAPTFIIDEGPFKDWITFVSFEDRRKYYPELVELIRLIQQEKVKILQHNVNDHPRQKIIIPEVLKPRAKRFFDWGHQDGNVFYFDRDPVGIYVQGYWDIKTDNPPYYPTIEVPEDPELAELNNEYPLLATAGHIWSTLTDAPCPIEHAFWTDQIVPDTYAEWQSYKKTIILSPEILCLDAKAYMDGCNLTEADPFWAIVHEIVHALYPYQPHDYLFQRGYEWAKAKIWSAMM